MQRIVGAVGRGRSPCPTCSTPHGCARARPHIVAFRGVSFARHSSGARGGRPDVAAARADAPLWGARICIDGTTVFGCHDHTLSTLPRVGGPFRRGFLRRAGVPVVVLVWLFSPTLSLAFDCFCCLFALLSAPLAELLRPGRVGGAGRR